MQCDQAIHGGTAISELVIFGAGGHARSVADVVLYNNDEQRILFVDENARPDEQIFGFDVVKELPSTIDAEAEFFVAVGDDHLRAEMSDKLGRLATIISKRAYVGRDASIGAGTFVGHGAHVGPLAKIGKSVIINTNATVDHESVVGDGSQICPGVNIAGRTKLGKFVFMGINSTIIERLNVCDDTKIGAGATVVKDITEPGTYVGTPARRITSR